MTYKETLDFLFSQLPMYQRQGKAAYKANLDNTHALDAHFKHPHRSFRTIHVAGTNGKGSSSHMLASVLQKAGYRVGLYTSPHLKDFRERVRVNGNMLPEQYVVDFVEQHASIFQSVKPSFFEMTVALAFEYFRSESVDIAVVEVGMGGRLDSTNIITPDVSVITNIGLDHVDFLGSDLASIAGEKAGIIKENIPVVIGQSVLETRPVFEKKAAEKNADIIFAEEQFRVPYAMLNTEGKQVLNIYQTDNVLYDNLQLDLLGFYQQRNICTVLATLEVLVKKGWKINKEHLYHGLSEVAKTTGLLGRWQILNHNPLVVCDTGHNEDGVQQLLLQIEATPHKQLHFVFGMVNDKNIDKILGMLPKEATYYFTRASIPRSLKAEELQTKATTFALKGNTYANVPDAIAAAKANASANDLVFIGGSTFVVADALVNL